MRISITLLLAAFLLALNAAAMPSMRGCLGGLFACFGGNNPRRQTPPRNPGVEQEDPAPGTAPEPEQEPEPAPGTAPEPEPVPDRTPLSGQSLPSWELMSLILRRDLDIAGLDRRDLCDILAFTGRQVSNSDSIPLDDLHRIVFLAAEEIREQCNRITVEITRQPDLIDQMDERTMNHLLVYFYRDPHMSLIEKRETLRQYAGLLPRLNQLNSLNRVEMRIMAGILFGLPFSGIYDGLSDAYLRQQLQAVHEQIQQIRGNGNPGPTSKTRPIFTDNQLLSLNAEQIRMLSVGVLRLNLERLKVPIFGVVEKWELAQLMIDAVDKMRLEKGLPSLQAPPTARDTAADSAQISIEQAQQMPVNQLKEALLQRGVSRRYMLDRSEMIQQLVELEKNKSQKDCCVICCDRKPLITDPRFPCGHKCFCADCGSGEHFDNLKTCPICRKPRVE